MIKKIFFGLINFISVLIIVAAVMILCVVIFTKQGEAPNILGYTALRITTGSMEPSYPVDTMIVVKQTDPSQIEEGDVISFYSEDPALDGAVNTHRVVSAEKTEDGWRYTTKGDANNTVDAYDVESQYLIGKVVFSSLILGKAARLVSNPLVFIPVILVPLGVILVGNMVGTISLARKIAKEEEEQAVKEAIQEIRAKREKEKQENQNEHQ